MPFCLIDELVPEICDAKTHAQLSETLARATQRLDFDHFALSYEHRTLSADRSSILLHDYPEPWATTYIAFDLAGDDPVRRACERTMVGFAWKELERLVPLTRGDRQMLAVGVANGIADGYTVPRHLPGYASGSCTFAVRPGRDVPVAMLPVAELLGGVALASAKRIAGEAPDKPRPTLSQRQRECVLWSARGKTAAKTARILGISEETVIQHLRTARERYDVHSRHALILCSLFDGLISFSDIQSWWYFQ